MLNIAEIAPRAVEKRKRERERKKKMKRKSSETTAAVNIEPLPRRWWDRSMDIFTSLFGPLHSPPLLPKHENVHLRGGEGDDALW